MKTITKLTKAQVARLDEIREKWLSLGLSTEPADRPMAERGIELAYKAAGLTPPTEIIWVESPLALQLKANELLYPKTEKLQYFWPLGGNLWAGTAAYYEVYAELGICADLTEGTRMIAASAGWWLPLDRACVISDRPKTLLRDDQGRLHCEDGPAMEWRDGYGLWAIHGVRVSRNVIEDDPAIWSPAKVIAEPNVEVRRVMIDRMGIDRLLDAADVVDAGEFGTLHRVTVVDDEDITFVTVVNSSPEADGSFKNYYLRVPPDQENADEAVAWTFGLQAAEYLPEIMT